MRTDSTRSHTPVYQVMLTLQNAPKGRLSLGDVVVEPEPTSHVAAKCDLSIAITNPVVARKFHQQGLASVPFEPAVPFRSCLAFGTAYRASRASQA